jgi:hypothetical protein
MICDEFKGGGLARLENNSMFLSRWSSCGRYREVAELRCSLVKKGFPQAQQGHLQEIYFQLESWAYESVTSSHLVPSAHWSNLMSINYCYRRVPKHYDSGRIVPRLRGCLPRPEELPDDSHCEIIYVQRCTIFAPRHLNIPPACPLTG